MRVIPKDKVIFSFNTTNPASYTVQDGETFWVEADDCYSGQITDALWTAPWVPFILKGLTPAIRYAWR